MSIRVSLLAAALLLPAALPATGQLQIQDGLPPQLQGVDVARGGRTLGRFQGAVRALGDRYKAELAADFVEFVPGLGREVPRNLPLRLSLDSIQRGGQQVWSTQRFEEPLTSEFRARYDRGGGVEERYDVLPEGLEMSFLVEEPLGDSGDLTVRMALETELEPARWTPAEAPLDFLWEGAPAVRIGEVTGIDAYGREVRGELGYDGTWLDLTLPAEFVDGASWPILVDPFLSTSTDVFTGTVFDPDVAYDPASDRYLVVWTYQSSLVDPDVRARILTGSGAPNVFVLPIETGDAITADPSVGCMSDEGYFVVGWAETSTLFTQTDIRALGIDADSPLTFTNFTTVSSMPEYENEVCVASQGANFVDQLYMLWTQEGVGIRYARVQLQLGQPVPLQAVGTGLLTASANASKPAISETGGPSNHWLAGWQEFFTAPAPGDHDMQFRLLDPFGPVGGEVELGTLGPDEVELTIDGDGESFAVSYAKTPPASASQRVQYRRVERAGATLSFGSEWQVPGTGNSRPQLAYTGYDYIRSLVTPTESIILGEVDPYSFEDVDGLGLGADMGFGDRARMASAYHGTLEPSSKGMVTYIRDDGAGETLYAYLLAAGQGITELVDECGQGGKARMGLPALGNDLHMNLVDSRPSQFAFLLMGFGEWNVPCEGCVLVPQLAGPAPIVWNWATDSEGDATVILPIPTDPSLKGANLAMQWLVYEPTDPACSLWDVDMSSAQRLTLF